VQGKRCKYFNEVLTWWEKPQINLASIAKQCGKIQANYA
jgi:hypothetical protein